MVNGGLVSQLYFWVLAGAVALAGAFFGIAVRMHIKFDDAFQKRIEDWMKEVDAKIHKYRNEANAVATRQRWDEEDRERHRKERGK
jgi:hypothetical protein